VSDTGVKTVRASFVRVGASVALLLPERLARAHGFLPGMSARVVLLNSELRVRHNSAPKLYDLDSLDEYRERLAAEELERSRRELDE
jgi:antitoxin component of MazEF toxin-antitoxin module